MKAGLRLQILLLLGGLLLIAFLPLYFAMSTYIRVALETSRTESSRALGRTAAAYVAEAATTRDARELQRLLDVQISGTGILALVLYDDRGNVTARAGDAAILATLPTRLMQKHEATRKLDAVGSRLAITVASQSHTVTAVVFNAEPRVRVLNQLLALYMALVALALLVATHLTVTRWIIRPVGELSLAAKRVLTTTRELETPPIRSREIGDLFSSLKTMTQRLLNEEASLRKKVQEVEQAQAKLKKAQAQLVHSERLASVGQLAAGLAHEVGNPIAAMLGMQDLILSGDLEPEEQLDFIQRMRKETERISEILRELLQFARAGEDAGNKTLNPGNVEAAITETVTLVAPQPILRDVDLALDIFPDLPQVSLSHGQLTQVLLNLIMNAAAACNGNGAIRISAREHPTGVELIVEDDGPGIPETLRETLFEPFVSSKDVGQGTGLGLSVCRGLVEASGGSIRVDKDYADGARFILELASARHSAPPRANPD